MIKYNSYEKNTSHNMTPHEKNINERLHNSIYKASHKVIKSIADETVITILSILRLTALLRYKRVVEATIEYSGLIFYTYSTIY